MTHTHADPARPRRADVAASYDWSAGAYEALWSPVILPPAAALAASLGLIGRCVVADVGAGTGALLGVIRAAAPAARVLALDASAEMLHVARARRSAAALLADALALLPWQRGRRRGHPRLRAIPPCQPGAGGG